MMCLVVFLLLFLISSSISGADNAKRQSDAGAGAPVKLANQKEEAAEKTAAYLSAIACMGTLGTQCIEDIVNAAVKTTVTPQMLTTKTFVGPVSIHATAIELLLADQVNTYHHLDNSTLNRVADLNVVLQHHLTMAGHPQGLATTASVQEVATQMKSFSAHVQELSGQVQRLSTTVEHDRKERAALAAAAHVTKHKSYATSKKLVVATQRPTTPAAIAESESNSASSSDASSAAASANAIPAPRAKTPSFLTAVFGFGASSPESSPRTNDN